MKLTNHRTFADMVVRVDDVPAALQELISNDAENYAEEHAKRLRQHESRILDIEHQVFAVSHQVTLVPSSRGDRFLITLIARVEFELELQV